MARDISIGETIEDKNSWYNIKKFKIGDTDFWKPEKSLDSRAITKETFDEMELKDTLRLSEASRVVHSYNEIDDVYNEDDNSKINAFFHKKSWLTDVPNVLNLTFDFNPLKSVKKRDAMTGFFDLYYQYPKLFVSVPNIRTKRVYTEPYRKEIIIDVKGYIKFVDEAYEILNDKNNKPIFVPISLRMSQHDINTLINHYLKKEYYYYWFDFEGNSINENILGGRTNYLFRIVKSSGYYKKIICYFTNMRREIISNSKDPLSPASDVLSSIAGANIVGVNREPRRNVKDVKDLPPPEHKARLLDSHSYYYVQTENAKLFRKDKYVPHNALRLQMEFDNQSRYFSKNLSLDKLLEKKEMLTKYKSGAILKELTSKSSDRIDMGGWL